MTADALNRIQPNLRLEAVGFLRAFDVNRERIYAIAAKVYLDPLAFGSEGEHVAHAPLVYAQAETLEALIDVGYLLAWGRPQVLQGDIRESYTNRIIE